MRTKSKYREIKSGQNIPAESPAEEIPEPNIPKVEIDGEEIQPVATVSVDASPDVEPSDAIAHTIAAAAKADDAALALKRQVEALQASEQLQREQAAAMMASQRPLTREQKLEFWKLQGLSAEETKFLQSNPEMIDHSAITNHAAAAALHAGHERDSEPYFAAVKTNFEEHMKQLQAQAAAQPTPEFFRPPPPPPPPPPPSPANFVSAPVSRDVPSPDRERYGNPGKVTLSVDELQIAKASGISPAEYARLKLRLEAEKRTGVRQ